ncbi:MAG: RuBisCO large subunit C-terminal-like domain-containing protein [Gemmataceae bacterium]
MSHLVFVESVNLEENFIATYELEGKKSLRDAAWELAIGQSVGNPNVRNAWETDELFIKYSCKVIGNEESMKEIKRGIVKIAFPIINTNWKEDGITQLLVQVMGGQLDIDNVSYCRLVDLIFPPAVLKYFQGPKFGITGVREFLGIHDKPLVGGIIKPKTGITPEILAKMVEELVEGGVNFIKEDEILSNPNFCPISVRVPLVMDVIKRSGKKVVYCVCINADFPYVIDRVKEVHRLGGNGVHINFWNGLGVYKAVRELDLPIFVHFQKSGDKILTDKSHRFSIDFKIIAQLAGMMGVDFMHAGMWGGYMSNDEAELAEILDTLHTHNVIPALSCGMHPGIVNAVKKRFGINFLANCGGAIHGHPHGSKAGAEAMRAAVDRDFENEEYKCAIAKWGLLE